VSQFEYTPVETDGQTDRQTGGQTDTILMHARFPLDAADVINHVTVLQRFLFWKPGNALSRSEVVVD